MGDLFVSMDIAAAGMRAQRVRMDVIAQNIANAEATRTESGGPYRRRQVVFQAVSPAEGGKAALLDAAWPLRARPASVRAAFIAEDPRPFREVFDPGHPDADARGIVRLPNVHVVEEMVDLTAASRGFEANAATMEAAKKMFLRTIELLR